MHENLSTGDMIEPGVSFQNEKVSTAKLSVASNSFLVALKLVVGLLMGSVGVISEAIHSGVDLIAALLATYSVRMSSRPADAVHRYGHGKFENLSGMLEGALIIVAAMIVLYEAGRRLLEGAEVEMLGYGMAVMAVSAILNYFISRRLMRVAKKTESLALEADAYHLMTDVWTSVGVFIALVLIYLTGIQEIDSIIAVFVAAMIVRAGYDITRRSTRGLLDVALPEEEMKAIEVIMAEHGDMFVNFHKLRARRTGTERQVDLHLTVPKSLSVKESHDLSEHLEREINQKLPNCETVIHIEPCDERCEKCRMYGSEKVFRKGRTS